MNLTSSLLLASVAFTAVVSLSANAPRGDGPADYKFRAAPVNSLGIRGIPDLRGKPILIDFWGHN